MTKGIPTLIKLKKREVDELRKELADLERQKDTLTKLLEELGKQLLAEMQLVANEPEMVNYFGSYSKRVRKRQEDLHKEIQVLEQKINVMRDRVAEAFGEQKRYEIVEANAKLRVQKELDRKQQIMLDELGSQQFRRAEENA